MDGAREKPEHGLIPAGGGRLAAAEARKPCRTSEILRVGRKADSPLTRASLDLEDASAENRYVCERSGYSWVRGHMLPPWRWWRLRSRPARPAMCRRVR